MLKRLLILLSLLITALAVHAQGAPEQIHVAVADLSNRVGRTLALGDLARWEWAQVNYPDASLGCPQEGQVYAQVITPGYQFELTYGGTVYDYRVSADQTVIILCGTVSEGQATLTPTPVDPNQIDTGVLCANPEPGVLYLPSRLTTQMQARVVPGGAPNNVRVEPRTDAGLAGEIAPNGVFTIIAGPQCANGFVWWQVDFDGLVGWTAEGRDGEYWLEPLPPRALPVNLTSISTDNADQLTELSRAEGNFQAELAWSPDGRTLAVLGGRGAEGVWLYNRTDLETSPRFLRDDSLILSLTFAPDSQFLLLGDMAGGVHLWDLDPNAPLLEATFLQGHDADVMAVAFAPDGSQFASVGPTAFTVAPVERGNAILVWDRNTVSQTQVLSGHTARVNTLAFSPDGALLASGSGAIDPNSPQDFTVRLWDVATGEQRTALEGHTAPVRSIAFSPDGALLASGSLDGTVRVWSVESGEETSAFQHGTGVISIAFSPDGTLLASGGGDPNVTPPDFGIRLWAMGDGVPVADLQGHTGTIGGLAFSADGQVLASASDDRTVRLWGVGFAG
jgi:WD40 repeat protein